MSLTVWVYRLSARLPAEEKSGLSAAMRRASTAVAQKCADADGRAEVGDAIKNYEAALASLRELLTAALICRRLKYIHHVHMSGLRRRIARVESLIDEDLQTCLDAQDEKRAADAPAPPPIPIRRAA